MIECYHRNIKISDIVLKFQFSTTEYLKQRQKLTTSSTSDFRSESPGYAERMVSPDCVTGQIRLDLRETIL